MASLIDVLDESDFGLFILAPSDVTEIKEREKQTVRNNVIFELGLFIGRLGTDRCFLITPRGTDDLHLPTDLLGITPADFDPGRQDGNMRAALGPACNRIRKAVQKLSRINTQETVALPETALVEQLCTDDDDCISLIQSWMGSENDGSNTSAIRYADVDRTLRLVD